ncbi:MAG: 3-oxoacid CoA-transferase subunit A [Actinomycetota bacterium]|jgi:3-oxoadipate CoA-transferase alpha subunit|nr:3-oxoacid CoA-transferase subunit A [Actinomycetota bacterium]
MPDKQCTMQEAFEGIEDGATVMVGGFGNAGEPIALLEQLLSLGVRDLVIVANNGGSGEFGLARLLRHRRVRKLICSYPRTPGSTVAQELYAEGAIELEVVPQGTLAERIRAAGAGIGGFYTPTGAGTELTKGREQRIMNGRAHVLELPLSADVALVKADRADPWGNLTYHLAARNFNPIMATAASLTIAQVREVVSLGEIPPEQVVTPSVYVDRIVETGG